MHTFNEPFSPPANSPEPEHNTALHKTQEVRNVRFLLSPPPEEDGMATRQVQPRAVREQRVVLPTAPKEEELKLGSSSRWGRNHLKMLGVDFYMKRKLDLNRVLKVRESEWSPELRARISEGARQLAAVDMDDLHRGAIDIDDVADTIAPKFAPTFTALLDVMSAQEFKQHLKQMSHNSSSKSVPPSSTSTTHAHKRPPQSPIQISAKRARQTGGNSPSPLLPEPQTPDQPTHPSNPNWTGSTTESKDEENTKVLLKFFLLNTMSALGGDFRRINWQQSGYRVELVHTARDTTKFKLGVETVVAINDGGIGIRYNAGQGNVDWQPGGIRPVLALEAKRRRSSKKDDIELVYEYAGQIFCEMLGQICYKEFYENPEMKYQQAFVIHGSHSSVTIYYARLPNSYLTEISRHGVKYLQRSQLKQHVQLRRTKKFHMRFTAERIELFNLLAKLLWYLISGKSHVGYLYNYPGNPIHKIGQTVYDDIMVEMPAGDVQDNVVIDIPASGEEEGVANSSFSEATDEDGGMEKEFEGDSLDEGSDNEVMKD